MRSFACVVLKSPSLGPLVGLGRLDAVFMRGASSHNHTAFCPELLPCDVSHILCIGSAVGSFNTICAQRKDDKATFIYSLVLARASATKIAQASSQRAGLGTSVDGL